MHVTFAALNAAAEHAQRAAEQRNAAHAQLAAAQQALADAQRAVAQFAPPPPTAAPSSSKAKRVQAYTLLQLADTQVITVLTACPCKASATHGHAQFAALRSGQTVAQARKAGCTSAYIKWFAQRKAIALS